MSDLGLEPVSDNAGEPPEPIVAPEGSAFAGLTLPPDIIQRNSPPVEPTVSDFAKGVLADIPEADRATVERYLKTWDGNVTKKFQEIHDEYKPYKDLGPVENVQNALHYMQVLNEDPLAFIELIKEALKEEGIPVSNDDQGNSSNLPEYEGIPAEFLTEFKAMKEELGTIKGSLEQTSTAFQEKTQLEQLDKLLGTLHTTHGDFPDEFILMEMSRGKSPDEAFKAWSSTLSKYSSPVSRKPPPSLVGGNGSVPSGQVDLSKLGPTERKALLTQALNNVNSG